MAISKETIVLSQLQGIGRGLMMHECPRCGQEMEQEEAEPDVGLVGGWVCSACDYAELDDPLDGDIEVL
jgi:hypothetical protein